MDLIFQFLLPVFNRQRGSWLTSNRAVILVRKKLIPFFFNSSCDTFAIAPIMKDYRTLAAEKQLQRSNKIPKHWLVPSNVLQHAINLLEVPGTCGLLSEIECKITSKYDATAVLEKLRSGTWSAEQVTVAFCKRAAIAQQLVSHHVRLLESSMTLILSRLIV